MAPTPGTLYNAKQEGSAPGSFESVMQRRANHCAIMSAALGGLTISACAPVGSLWDDCQFRTPRSVTIDAAGLRSVKVVAFSGELEIEGVEDLLEVRVTGSACALEEQWLEGIDVRAERQGVELAIEAVAPAGRAWEGTGRLDLEIEVPSSMRLDVVDGSGPAEVTNVTGLLIDDGAGSLSILGVAGDVEVKDGGGDLDIEDVRGHVKIADGRGDIDVRDVGGSVTMTDRNGDVSVKRVAGDFALQSDARGEISHSDIAGRVSILGKNRGGP